jgi:hypothetical protein
MNTSIEREERAIGISEGFVEAGRGASQAGLGFMMGVTGLIGVWGAACLISAVAQTGVLELARGWLSAITGM